MTFGCLFDSCKHWCLKGLGGKVVCDRNTFDVLSSCLGMWLLVRGSVLD